MIVLTQFAIKVTHWAIPKENWNQDSKIKKDIETNKSKAYEPLWWAHAAGEKSNVIFFWHSSGSDPLWHQSWCFHSQSTQNLETSEPECLILDSWSPRGDRWKKSTEAAARELWSASSPVWPSSEAERVLTEKGGSDDELIGLEIDHTVDVM